MPDTPKLEETVEFARCPCVLLLDTSGSMAGEAIDALNQGIQAFQLSVSKDPLASRRVEVALVTFDCEINVVQDFITADQFQPPTLTAQGQTKMGSAIIKALDMIKDRKATYKANGVTYYRPWVFMITDGEPQGEPDVIVQQAAARVKAEEASKQVAFFAVGVGNANMESLASLVVRQPQMLIGLNFVEMFVWLSKSMGNIAQSKTDEQVALPPAGWGAV